MCVRQSLINQNQQNDSYSVFSLEQFLKPFDQVCEELSRPPKDKVDVKDLVKQLQEEKLLGKSKEANEVGVLQINVKYQYQDNHYPHP